MGDPNIPVFKWEGALIASSLKIEFTSVPEGIHADFFLYCETVDSHYEYFTFVDISEEQFGQFLTNCLVIFQGLANPSE